MQYADLGITPITEASPTGVDVSGEPLYDQLSTEIKKLSSPTAEGGIDWQAIERLSSEILATKSKHILVACCLCIARQHSGGWHGFAEGVTVLHDLLLTYWDTCFPTKKRMRGRKNAISWWLEMIDGLIKTSTGEEWPTDERAALLATLEKIDQFLGENMEDAPILRPTIQALAGNITEPPVAEPQQPPPTAPSSAPQAQPAAAAPAPSSRPRQEAMPTPSAELPPEKNLALACDFLRLVSSQYLQSDPCHPLAFRLNRIIAWFPLDSLPLADNGTTMVPPPDSYKITALQNLAASNNWADLLETAEQQITQYLFWLDLQRHAATALERLGRDLARDGVVYETLLLIKRLPGLEKLRFSDGTPFADAATRDWLKELGKGEQSGGGQSTADQAGDAMAELVNKAQALATGNKLGEALQSLQQGSESATSGRSRLQWNLATCRLLCRSQQPLLAAPFASTMLEQLKQHGLEQWEPSLAEEVLVTVYQVLRLQEKDEQERMQSVLHRLTILNPARALDLIS